MRVAPLYPTLCDPMDYTACGILQARILEWVAFPFSRDLPSPEIKPRSPALQVDSLPTELSGKGRGGFLKYIVTWKYIPSIQIPITFDLLSRM